jgi:hypothetical protein
MTGGNGVEFGLKTFPACRPGKARVGPVVGSVAFGRTAVCPGGGSGKSQGRGTSAAGQTQVAAQTTPSPLFWA